MFFTPPQPVLQPAPATVIASVAQPVMAQKTNGSALLNGTEYRLVQGLTNWQHSYTPASAATQSVPVSLGDIVPRYGFTPAIPSLNQNWSYGTGTYQGLPAGYACLSGSFSFRDLTAVEYAQRFYPQSGYFFSTACGATASTWPASTPADGALTLWLQPAPSALNHLKAMVSAVTQPLNPVLPPVVVNPTPPPAPTPPPTTKPGKSGSGASSTSGCSGGWFWPWGCGWGWGHNWW